MTYNEVFYGEKMLMKMNVIRLMNLSMILG